MLASTLLLGVVLLPYPAHASFLSDLFGTSASADNVDTIAPSADSNSQNISLLEANVSSASVINDQKKGDKGTDGEVKENADVTISDNALTPNATLQDPSGTDGETFSDQVSTYVVRKGDSIGPIAKMFGVSVNTIYWANDLKKGDKLKEGTVLVILPFDGVSHTVKAKDTIASIAKLYDADVDDILAFNGLNKGEKLIAGDELIIPDGEKSEDVTKPTKSKTNNSSSSKNIAQKNLKSVDGYFIFPLPFKRQTQGMHDRYAKDYGAPVGTPIYAPASGTVVLARNGYNGGYGNYVVMHHPNGLETRYGHMSKLATTSGKQVVQGELIGYVGSTGRSTGPHLHWEIRGPGGPVKFPF